MPVAIVVGPGKHFGLELCVALAKSGFDIAVISRTDALDDEIGIAVRGVGRKFAALRADVRHSQAFEHAMLEVADVVGDVGCIIYNVKFSPKGPALTMPPELLTDALAANVSGSLCVLRTAPKLMQNVERRVIVLTGGGFMRTPDYSRMPLSLSKAAIHSMVTTLRLPMQQHHGIELKTLTISGVVRPSGPLLPGDVAHAFVHLIDSRTRSTSEIVDADNAGQELLEFDHSDVTSRTLQ